MICALQFTVIRTPTSDRRNSSPVFRGPRTPPSLLHYIASSSSHPTRKYDAATRFIILHLCFSVLCASHILRNWNVPAVSSLIWPSQLFFNLSQGQLNRNAALFLFGSSMYVADIIIKSYSTVSSEHGHPCDLLESSGPASDVFSLSGIRYAFLDPVLLSCNFFS